MLKEQHRLRSTAETSLQSRVLDLKSCFVTNSAQPLDLHKSRSLKPCQDSLPRQPALSPLLQAQQHWRLHSPITYGQRHVFPSPERIACALSACCGLDFLLRETSAGVVLRSSQRTPDLRDRAPRKCCEALPRRGVGNQSL